MSGAPEASGGEQPKAAKPKRAVYCDVDGTIAKTTIVTPLLWYKRTCASPLDCAIFYLLLPLRGPFWLLLDKISRDASNRAIYMHYRGLRAEDIEAEAWTCYARSIKPRLFPKALARLKQFRADGYRLVLVTGGIDILMRPLAVELGGAEVIAPSLGSQNGILTGALQSSPLVGERKANAIHAHAEENGIDLAESYAMGDALGDLAMLECVGHPIAVNAGKRLAAVAKQRGWPCEQWR